MSAEGTLANLPTTSLPPLQIVRVYPHLCSVYHVRRQTASVVAQLQRLFEEHTHPASAGQDAMSFIAEVFGYDQNMALADGYQVVAVGKPDTVLYDFWCYGCDEGLVFETNTVTLTGVSYADLWFSVVPGFADPDGRAAALAVALNAAETVDAPGLDPDAPLVIERDSDDHLWLVGFTSADAIPSTPVGWDELLSDNSQFLHLREDFVRCYGQDFGHEACVTKWLCAPLSEAYIREFARTNLDWRHVSLGQTLSETFIREFADQVVWQTISNQQRLSEAFIVEFQDRVDWGSLAMSQKLSESFIREHASRLDWSDVASHQQLSEAFIAEFADRLDFRKLDPMQPRSTAFYRAHQHQLDWGHISQQGKLSEEFIRAFADQLDWRTISSEQRLSTAFVEEFADRIQWWHFSFNHHLSDEQITHFKDRLDWVQMIHFNRTLPEALIRQHEALIPSEGWEIILSRKLVGPAYLKEIAARLRADFCK